MKKEEIIKALFFILISLAAGAIGTVFTAPAIPGWYAALEKPVFSPPNWLFGPVWTTLYILMGISAYLVWKKGIEKKDVKIAIYVFSIQLILNALWSYLFFGLHSPFYAFAEIMMLWLAIAVTITKFYRIDKTASYLLIPYIAWVSFASVLNYYIYVLNS